PLPDSTSNLLRVMGLKQACRRIKILKIDAGPKGATVQFHAQPLVKPEGIIQLLQEGGGTIRLNHDTQTLSIKERAWEESTRRIDDLYAILGRL
ncbi:MAG: hypothetical protein HQL97_15805, partial [Magnetococcales bacterium]|nr:hypothetical protein [Magnetococcales bacterium]